MTNLLLKLFSRLHVALLRLFGGRRFNRFGGAPLLTLSVRGRKSGRLRTVPLLFIRDGERYVVIASKGGYPEDPDWYKNLMTASSATIQVGQQVLPVTAQTVTGTERNRLWLEATKAYSAYEDYAKKTTREIPVVALTPELGSTERP